MNTKQQRKVNEQFVNKASSMTKEDMNGIIEKKEKVFSLFKKVGKHAEDFKLLWGLLNDYKNGTYKAVPWKLIAAIIFAFVYLVSPVDVIPDVIPVLGLTDDISVFGLVLSGFAAEIEAYKAWRENQNVLLIKNVNDEKEV